MTLHLTNLHLRFTSLQEFLALSKPPTMEELEASMANATVNSHTKSPFLKIPREVRDQIYDLVWSGKKVVRVHKHGYAFCVQYAPEGQPGRVYPWMLLDYKAQKFRVDTLLKGSSWLLTDKLFLSEGLEAFQRQAYWTSVEGIQRSTRFADGALLTPYAGRNWTFDFGLQRRGEIMTVFIDDIGIALYEAARIKTFTQSGLEDTHLRQLTFRLEIIRYLESKESKDDIIQPAKLPKPGVPIIADLSILENFQLLAEVHKLQIVLESFRLSRNECRLAGLGTPKHVDGEWKYAEEDSQSSAMYRALMREVSRVGRIIIGKADPEAAVKVTEDQELGWGHRNVVFTFEKE